MNKKELIALVGGGSGGHVFPLVALGEALKKKSIPFIYIGSSNSVEAEVISGLKWRFIEISAGKWRRYVTIPSIVQNIVDVFKTIKGFFQSVRLIRRKNIKLIISKGGYVSLPVLYAAKVVGCPIIVHESDSVMGLSNRVGGKFARSVLTAFDPKTFPLADGRYRKVGIPIRASLRQAATLKSPKKDRPLILVLPGSQGSVAINRHLKDGLRNLLESYDIVHLVGKKDFELFEKLRAQLPIKLKDRYRTYSFIDRELSYYYQLADLIIVRGSATTAAEAALFSKPIYMIPIPGSANNHQEKNAKTLEAVGAAIVKQQYQLSGEELVTDIEGLMGDKDKLRTLGSNLASYFDSTESIDRIIEEINNVLHR